MLSLAAAESFLTSDPVHGRPPNFTHEIRFGRFILQPARRVLLADGQPVKLGARAFDLLMQLVQQAGRVVTKSEHRPARPRPAALMAREPVMRTKNE